MILDNEDQRQNLLSLLAIVPFSGNISQGIDRMVAEVKNLMEIIKQAKLEEKGETK